ncbi:glycoside hydrolase family 16 protein [Peniophora sp. CONT]|nr:glycoside hydrolase family 16 protein [Peniophora sp. CONT]
MSTRMLAALVTVSLGTSVLAATPLKLANNYSGKDFFNGFRFNITDANHPDPNGGNIHSTAMAGPSPLAFVNNAGNIILRVDNTTNDLNPGPYSIFGRNTVQVISNDPININTLLVASVAHIPFGCSVWPAFWTLDAATQSDVGGEIDIIEPVNLMTQNQYSLHTRTGCTASESSSFPHTGTKGATDCDANSIGGNTGCIIQEPAQNSVGPNFAGGVYAMYWSTNGIQMWLFPTSSIPSDLQSNSPDPSTWPTPSASYPASTCDPNTFFSPQEIIFDIDICGPTYAGLASVFHETCPNVSECQTLVANGANYDNAYWEINYVKTFIGGPSPLANSSSTATTGSAAPTGSASSNSSTGGTSSSNSNSSNSSGAIALETGVLSILCTVVGVVLAGAVSRVL